jgi:hypothetical protein
VAGDFGDDGVGLMIEFKNSYNKSYAVEELPEEVINYIAASHMDSRHDHLNKLLAEEFSEDDAK